jgi:hypothetical protein
MNDAQPNLYILAVAGFMTAPMVPPEVDLRDFPFVPLFRRRLFASRFHRLAGSEEWKAGVILWWKSWDEIPAGSLPSDDRELWRLAEVQDNLAWRKIRKWALHGWEKCDDGRLYHPVVAEVTLYAWERKQAQRRRTAAATEARWKNRDGSVTASVTESNARVGRPRKEMGIASPKSPSRHGEGDLLANSLDKGKRRQAVEPKIIGHILPCSCPNCTAWVAQQHAGKEDHTRETK